MDLLQKQIEELQRQNEALRAGRNQANNQAELLRQQQALRQYGNTPAVDVNSADWYSQLGIPSATPPAEPETAAPAPPQTVTLTVDELKKLTEVAQRADKAASIVQAQQTQKSLQDRLAREYPDMVNETMLPVIQRVWLARRAENPQASPDDLFKATIEESKALVNHVKKGLGGSNTPNNTHPYGITPYNHEAAPWERESVPQKATDLYQAVPGNERPEWVEDLRAVNRQRKARALHMNSYTAGTQPNK